MEEDQQTGDDDQQARLLRGHGRRQRRLRRRDQACVPQACPRVPPDRNKKVGAEERFKEINEAYQVLSDPNKRSAYDRFGHRGVNGNGATGFEGYENFGGFGDIFDAFFGGGPRTQASSAIKGADLQYAMTIEFEKAVFGGEEEFDIQRIEVCSGCRGSRSAPGSSRTKCTNCGGAGKVRRAHQSIFGQFVQVTDCATCRGEGKIIIDPCSTCSGAGRERRKRSLVVSVPAGSRPARTSG